MIDRTPPNMKTQNRAAPGRPAQAHPRILISRLFYYLSSIPTLLLGVRNWATMLRVFAGLPVRRPIEISLRDGLRFQVRTALDIWVLKEACLDRQYESASVRIEDGWTVVDIGAGLGDFAVSAARDHPRAHVAAYEPFPDSFALLQENLQLNRIDNVRALPLAVSGESGSLRLRAVSGEAVQQSTVVGADGDGVQVESVTLDQVIGNLQASRCDYLKMDCEGAEYGILFHTSPATLSRIRHVCLEYHDDVTQYTHLDLIRFFEQNGYAVRVVPNRAHWQWGLLYASNEKNQIEPH
ncbi:MAG: FkbM family methyltransferase [Chloroflexi bacterium]|nr:FkbM family methyltransferase [Chloroflexota bacterium]